LATDLRVHTPIIVFVAPSLQQQSTTAYSTTAKSIPIIRISSPSLVPTYTTMYYETKKRIRSYLRSLKSKTVGGNKGKTEQQRQVQHQPFRNSSLFGDPQQRGGDQFDDEQQEELQQLLLLSSSASSSTSTSSLTGNYDNDTSSSSSVTTYEDVALIINTAIFS